MNMLIMMVIAATVDPKGQFKRDIVWSKTVVARTLASIPPIRAGVTNQAIQRDKTKMEPVKTPGILNGKVTVKKALILPAPRLRAASIKL
jgi:hypothetical protein